MLARLMPRSIRWRAVLGSVVAVAFLGTLLGSLTYLLVTEDAQGARMEILHARVEEVAAQIADVSPGDVDPLTSATLASNDSVFVRVQDSTGQLLAITPGLNVQAPLCNSGPLPDGGIDDLTMSINGTEAQFQRIYRRVSSAQNEYVICAAISDESIERSQSSVFLALLTILPLVTVGVGVLVWWAVGRTLRVVESLRSQAEELTTSDSELKVESTGDEVERLGSTLNDLLHRLHQQSQATRQFVLTRAMN